jgi:predicted dehydrogenase
VDGVERWASRDARFSGRIGPTTCPRDPGRVPFDVGPSETTCRNVTASPRLVEASLKHSNQASTQLGGRLDRGQHGRASRREAERFVIRVAVIGYGYWGPKLARNLHDTDGAELVAIADQAPDRLDLAADDYPDLRHSLDAASVLDDDRIDAVVIATPVSTHHELGRRALARGKHVLIEKPLARSVEEAEELTALARETGAVLMIDDTFVYTGAVRKVRELIEAGSLGELLYVDSVRANLGLVQRDVDVIWDLAPHDLSVLLYLFGCEPQSVAAIGADPARLGQTSLAYLTYWFPDGAIAHLHLSWLSPVKVRRMLVAGSDRMVVFDDLEPSEKVRIHQAGVTLDPISGVAAYRRGGVTAPVLDDTEALANACAHFVDCICHGTEPITGGRAGISVVRSLEAASRSLRSNGARFPVATPGAPPPAPRRSPGLARS